MMAAASIMKVVTYNIRYGLGLDNRYDLARIANAVRGADIIALQEVERLWRRSGMTDQPEQLGELLYDYYWTYCPSFDVDASMRGTVGAVVNRRRQFGPMLLSKWPILSARVIVLPLLETVDLLNLRSGAIEGIIATPAGVLRVYSLHLSSISSRERLAQIDALFEVFSQGCNSSAPITGGTPADPGEAENFRNGKTMMPADVVYSLNRHRGEDSKSGAAGSLTAIQKITASGPNEVTISLDAINADLPLILTDYHLLIQPEGSTDDGVGTGGYAITEYRPGEAGILERNPNYWGEGCYFDSVECLSINDATARTTALVTGKAHLIDRVDPKTTDLLKKNSKVVIENTTGRAHYVLPMHANTAPFDNNDLRLALKYAIDRQELVDKILQGYGAVGNDFPINQAYPYFTALEQREHDPDKASYHYKKSGHSGEILLQVSNAAFSSAEDAAVLYQQHAKRAGIKINVKREPADGYWDNIWNKQPFCASYWSGRPTQDQMYSVAYKSDAAWNDTRFFNDKFDKLLLSARGELNPTNRAEIYRDMAIIVRDEGGLICPMFNDFIDARAENLSGYIRDPIAALSNGLAPYRCWFAA